MSRFVEAVTLDAFSSSESICKYCMFSLSAVLALRNIWVHVGTPDSNNIASYIKTSVNEIFSLTTILNIPYVNPDNGHV